LMFLDLTKTKILGKNRTRNVMLTVLIQTPKIFNNFLITTRKR
jgi:hypothetical protein